jgi:hypothetical protein
MTLRFRDALTDDVDGVPTTAQTLPRIRLRLHHSRRKHRERRDTIGAGFALKSREVFQSSDSESETEEEEPLRGDPFGSHYYGIPPISRDGQQLFGYIYEMQEELDKVVRFIHSEVEGLAGSTSAFNVLAFTLEDWDR